MKHESRKELLPFAFALIILAFYLIIDGYSLFTLAWDKETAVIVSVNTIEFPVETYKRGNRIGYKSECKVELQSINDEKIYDMVILRKAIIGEKVDVRINPKTRELVINKTSFYRLLICSFLIITLLVGGFIQVFYNKKWSIER
jgi:hypothetical protein